MDKDEIRVFIAIELPVDIQKKLEEITEKLKNPQDKITWVKPHNIHLTLKFLGNVPRGDIDSIEKAIFETTTNKNPFEVVVKGASVFPRERQSNKFPLMGSPWSQRRKGSPRIIWIGITEEGNLKKIYIDLENRLDKIGYPKEKRNFTPHLTLGRVKHIENTERFIENLYKYKENVLGKMTIDSVSLIKSTLTPKGSIYETLYTAKLAV